MAPIIIGESVKGDSHIRQGKNRQDNFLIVEKLSKDDPKVGSKKYPVLIAGSGEDVRHRRLESPAGKYYKNLPDDVYIVAVADGHGSAACPYSEIGSQIAVEVFCDLMALMVYNYRDNLENLFVTLNRGGDTAEIAQKIVKAWEKRVVAHYGQYDQKLADEPVEQQNKPTVLKVGPMNIDVQESDEQIEQKRIWKMYGTTLLGILIVKDEMFSFQLGDGDITFVSMDSVEPVIEADKMLGVETHSISKQDSWKETKTKVVHLQKDECTPFMYVLSTDGWLNSHASEEDFHKTCLEYMKYIQEYGAEAIQSNMAEWLTETSRLGCGDDITVVCVYYQ